MDSLLTGAADRNSDGLLKETEVMHQKAASLGGKRRDKQPWWRKPGKGDQGGKGGGKEGGSGVGGVQQVAPRDGR